jgi:hypothetical protein
MSDNGADAGLQDSPEDDLRRNLARAGGMLGAVGPVLRHLLDKRDDALFGDEVVARLRAMLGDLARQVAGRDPGEAPCDRWCRRWPMCPALWAIATRWRWNGR